MFCTKMIDQARILKILNLGKFYKPTLSHLKAEDLDSEKSITYRLIAGDVDKFVINPETGEVSSKIY